MIQVPKRGLILPKLALKGQFTVRQFRNGKLYRDWQNHENGIVDEGLNKLLDVMFHATTQLTTWYMSLIDNTGFTALAAADTLASHAGWTEFTSYDEATRPEWTEGAAASKSIASSAASVFTINATGTIKGGFIASDNTKGGTTGTLWATSAFASTYPVEDNDVLNISYTASGASA